MKPSIHTDPNRRHDFLLLFDVTDGNPNGDPEAGNLPRADPQTGHGIVTDVCLKRKIRNYVTLTAEDRPGFDIYVQEKSVLARQRQRAYDSLGAAATPDAARRRMCELFYDVRLFGAVMSLKEFNAGQVRGPVQFTFARSFDPIFPMDLLLTRTAVATGKESELQGGENRTFARKAVVPYALYRAYGYVSAPLARQTGVTEADLALLWEALTHFWDLDRSAARGNMVCRGLRIFSHDSPLGNAPAQSLFDTVHVELQPDVLAPRRFADYRITPSILPNRYPGVTLTTLVDTDTSPPATDRP
ncbi:MAG: type I-C CRISPR-associated protein Cas7/Csd2 [Capsulimonadales bacterium]|nr:type I-C CRISPR-associated protein Cas7/Csd2 [Capsulimonadales bacterium]